MLEKKTFLFYLAVILKAPKHQPQCRCACGLRDNLKACNLPCRPSICSGREPAANSGSESTLIKGSPMVRPRISTQTQVAMTDFLDAMPRQNICLLLYPDAQIGTGIESSRLPAGAGLGGGSANAATTLWAANELTGRPATNEQLLNWSGAIGSDISVFFSRGAAYCTGRHAPLTGKLARWLQLRHTICISDLREASLMFTCNQSQPVHVAPIAAFASSPA